MILTCFCCNASGSIEAFSADSAASDFANLAGNLQPSTWRALLGYLGLFRTNRKLAFGKALRLAQETLALDTDQARLEIAMIETVEALRQRTSKPLKNHNYLKRVLESQPSGQRYEVSPQTDAPAPRSKAAQAALALKQWGEGCWLRREIAVSLSALVAQNLKHAPAAEVITANADIWHLTLKKSLTIEEIDLPRLWQAFEKLFPQLTEWPQPKQLIDLLPPRPQRQAITQRATDADRQAGSRIMREYLEKNKG